jgi:excisionase family DNA binding protein
MFKNHSESNITETPSGLMTRDQIAEFLQYSPRHISNLMSSKRIPFLKVGASVRFNPQAVLKALEKYEVQSI